MTKSKPVWITRDKDSKHTIFIWMKKPKFSGGYVNYDNSKSLHAIPRIYFKMLFGTSIAKGEIKKVVITMRKVRT